MAEKLNAGAHFPTLALSVGSDRLTLPLAMDSGYAIVLFYRGHW